MCKLFVFTNFANSSFEDKCLRPNNFKKTLFKQAKLLFPGLTVQKP